METLKQRIDALSPEICSLDGIHIRPIRDDNDLWYAVVQCRLAPGQDAYVNPAGFSIGRAYLHPERNVPCIIQKDQTPIGYIVLRQWHDASANSWSYYLDQTYQGRGYGKTAARLALRILTAADPSLPIKLSAERENTKAHRLYQSIGFRLSAETDGDDLVFIYQEVSVK